MWAVLRTVHRTVAYLGPQRADISRNDSSPLTNLERDNPHVDLRKGYEGQIQITLEGTIKQLL